MHASADDAFGDAGVRPRVDEALRGRGGHGAPATTPPLAAQPAPQDRTAVMLVQRLGQIMFTSKLQHRDSFGAKWYTSLTEAIPNNIIVYFCTTRVG